MQQHSNINQSQQIELNQANFFNSINEFLESNYLDFNTPFKINSLGKFGKIQAPSSTQFSKNNQPQRFISIGNDNYVNNLTGEITNSSDTSFIESKCFRKQSEKTRIEKTFSMFYTYRNSLQQLRFITLTCKAGTSNSEFAKSVLSLLHYLRSNKLFEMYVCKFEPQQNGTAHVHIIAAVASRNKVSDFIKDNRKLANKEYNGKKITNLYQLIRFSFETKMKCLGTEKLHCEFLEIYKYKKNNEYYLKNENGKTIKETNKNNNEYNVKLQNYINKGGLGGLKNCSLDVIAKLNDYMLKDSNVNNIDLGVKHVLHCSTNIPKVRNIYLSASELLNLDLKFKFFCKCDYLAFGALEQNEKFFNYFDMLYKKQQQNELQPLLEPQKNHPTFTLLELNFEPQNDLNKQYT